MTIKEIIDGLKFTVDMFMFDPMTGETKMPSDLNEDDLTTVNACIGARKILERYRWIPVTERMPEADGDYIVTTNRGKTTIRMFCGGEWMTAGKILAWMPLPEAYREEEEAHDNDR